VLLGGVFAQSASILDGVDGDLAKLSQKITRFGGFLDSLLDRYADVGILAGMGAYSCVFEGYPHAVLFSITAIIGSLMVSYSRAASEKIPGFSFGSPISNYLSNRDVRLLIVLAGSVFSFAFATLSVPFVGYSLILITILTNTTVFRRLLEVSNSGKMESTQ
jgi:CDP-L-myo-inositol myo-inositolphosphotransferase